MRIQWYTRLGIKSDRLRPREQTGDERAFALSRQARSGVLIGAQLVLDQETEQEVQMDFKPPLNEMMPALIYANLHQMPVRDMEMNLILNTLRQVNGNRTQAALILGITVRTLRNKVREYKGLGIPVPQGCMNAAN